MNLPTLAGTARWSCFNLQHYQIRRESKSESDFHFNMNPNHRRTCYWQNPLTSMCRPLLTPLPEPSQENELQKSSRGTRWMVNLYALMPSCQWQCKIFFFLQGNFNTACIRLKHKTLKERGDHALRHPIWGALDSY